MSFFNPFQTFKRWINSHLLKGGCVDQRLVSFCWHWLCYQTAPNASFCKINGLGLTQFGCSCSEVSLWFILWHQINLPLSKAFIFWTKCNLSQSYSAITWSCIWSQHNKNKCGEHSVSRGWTARASPAACRDKHVLTCTGFWTWYLCSDKQSWNEQWQKCDCPKLQFAPWESQWNPHQGSLISGLCRRTVL